LSTELRRLDKKLPQYYLVPFSCTLGQTNPVWARNIADALRSSSKLLHRNLYPLPKAHCRKPLECVPEVQRNTIVLKSERSPWPQPVGAEGVGLQIIVLDSHEYSIHIGPLR
jgi:hypothetical protein